MNIPDNKLIDAYLAKEDESFAKEYLKNETEDHITAATLGLFGGGFAYQVANAASSAITGNSISDYKNMIVESVTEDSIDDNGNTLADYFQMAITKMVSWVSDMIGGDHNKSVNELKSYAMDNNRVIQSEFDKVLDNLPDKVKSHKQDLSNIIGKTMAKAMDDSKGSITDNLKSAFASLTSDGSTNLEASKEIGQNIGKEIYTQTLVNVTHYLTSTGEMGVNEAKQIAAGIAGSVAGGTLIKEEKTDQILFVSNNKGLSGITSQIAHNIKDGKEATQGITLSLESPKYDPSISQNIDKYQSTTQIIADLTNGDEKAQQEIEKIRAAHSAGFKVKKVEDGVSVSYEDGDHISIKTIALQQGQAIQH